MQTQMGHRSSSFSSGNTSGADENAACAAPDAGSMSEDMFKWMAHTVNQDFVSMGYPAILAKSGDEEYVNLSPLIRNCSSVLSLIKSQEIRPQAAAACSSRNTIGSSARDRTSPATASAVTAATASTPTSARPKRRRWGLFSSKHHRRTAATRYQQQQQQQQQQQLQKQQKQEKQSVTEKALLHETMARKMRKDTERIIRRTACMELMDPAQTSSNCPPSPYPVESQEHQDFAFMHLVWHNFRKLAQSRITECAEAVKRSEDLQRKVASLTSQVERLRATSAPSAVAEDSTSLTGSLYVGPGVSNSSGGCGTSGGGGRLQKVGGFLRRAVSKERLTFGRRTKACDAATGNGADTLISSKRSRSCSLPGIGVGGPIMQSVGGPPALISPFNLEAEMRRMRLEFDRRERLLLSEREKLRKANCKLHFRVQHLSSLAAVSSKLSASNSGPSSNGAGASPSGIKNATGSKYCNGRSSSKEVDYQQRRLERRAAALQKEVFSLKKELNEKIDSLTGIGAAVVKFSKAATTFYASTPVAADGTITGAAAADQKTLADATGVDLPMDAARVSYLVDTVCSQTLARLVQLRQMQLEAQTKAVSLGDCLQLVHQRLGLTRAAMENYRDLEVELDVVTAKLTAASCSTAGSGVGGAIHRSMSVSGRRCPVEAPQLRSRADDELACSGRGGGGGGGVSAAGAGDQQKLELRDRIIGKLTTMLRERQDEVRRLKEISISCKDV